MPTFCFGDFVEIGEDIVFFDSIFLFDINFFLGVTDDFPFESFFEFDFVLDFFDFFVLFFLELNSSS